MVHTHAWSNSFWDCGLTQPPHQRCCRQERILDEHAFSLPTLSSCQFHLPSCPKLSGFCCATRSNHQQADSALSNPEAPSGCHSSSLSAQPWICPGVGGALGHAIVPLFSLSPVRFRLQNQRRTTATVCGVEQTFIHRETLQGLKVTQIVEPPF
jgi:hypothetical protein